MKVLIDADACPGVDITVNLCRKYHAECLLLCDTAHTMHRDGATTLVFDKGADSVDFALVNRVESADIVITQDYGLASMCLARNAHVLHQDGWQYTEYNIQALLFQRHESRKYRSSGGLHEPFEQDFTKNTKRKHATDCQIISTHLSNRFFFGHCIHINLCKEQTKDQKDSKARDCQPCAVCCYFVCKFVILFA